MSNKAEKILALLDKEIKEFTIVSDHCKEQWAWGGLAALKVLKKKINEIENGESDLRRDI